MVLIIRYLISPYFILQNDVPEEGVQQEPIDFSKNAIEQVAPPSGSIGDQKSMEDQQRDLTNLTGKERKEAYSKFLEPIQPNTGQKSRPYGNIDVFFYPGRAQKSTGCQPIWGSKEGNLFKLCGCEVEAYSELGVSEGVLGK